MSVEISELRNFSPRPRAEVIQKSTCMRCVGPEQHQGFVLNTGVAAIFLPDGGSNPTSAGVAGNGPGNRRGERFFAPTRKRMNHARIKRCRGKWAQYGPQRIQAMMVQEKRNCRKKYRKVGAKDFTLSGTCSFLQGSFSAASRNRI